ncbi:hypothetical protein YWS52_32250 [Chitiniphilus shinanonensis]
MCDGQQASARLLLPQKYKPAFVFSRFPSHPTGVPPVTWRRGVERDLRLATDVGNPGGAQTRGSFSLVRFFWRSKRNEPARPVAKGINQLRRRRSAFSGVAVQARPAVEGANQPRRRRSVFQKLKLPCGLPSHEGHQTTRATDARRLGVAVKARSAAKDINQTAQQDAQRFGIGVKTHPIAQPPPSGT